MTFWRESEYSSNLLSFSRSLKLPYKDIFWFVCKWTEESIDLRAKQVFSLIFFQGKDAQFPHVLSFRGLSKQFVQIGPAKSHYLCWSNSIIVGISVIHLYLPVLGQCVTTWYSQMSSYSSCFALLSPKCDYIAHKQLFFSFSHVKWCVRSMNHFLIIIYKFGAAD